MQGDGPLAERAFARPPIAGPASAQAAAQTRVDIIVCVHNAREAVGACLASLAAHGTDRHRVIVVDDASEPATADMVCGFCARADTWTLITNPTNFGYTRSANIGLRAAEADWVVLLNSDTVVTPGWVEGLLACALSDPATVAVGPLSNSATFQSVEALDPGPDPEPRLLADLAARSRADRRARYPSVPILNGFCTLFRREAVASQGYLDEDAFPTGYGEENNLCLSLIAAGHTLRIADDVFVYHARSQSFGTERRARLVENAVRRLAEMWPGYSYRYISQEVAKLLDAAR